LFDGGWPEDVEPFSARSKEQKHRVPGQFPAVEVTCVLVVNHIQTKVLSTTASFSTMTGIYWIVNISPI
jgi:hypothetical protein